MRLIRRLNDRIGNRGKFLGFLALLDFVYGYSLVTTPAILASVNLVLSYAAWGWIWIGTGFVCLAGAFMTNDRVSFSCAALLKTAWSGIFLYMSFTSHSIPRAWVGAVIWLAFAATVVMIAGWPEPPPDPDIPVPPSPFLNSGTRP